MPKLRRRSYTLKNAVEAVSVHLDQEVLPESQRSRSSFVTDSDRTLNSIINIGGGGSMVADNFDNVGIINVQQDGIVEIYNLDNFGIINVEQGGALEVHDLDNFGIINAQDGAFLMFHDHDFGIINAPRTTFTSVSSLHDKADASGTIPSEVESLRAELKNTVTDGILTPLGQVTLSMSALITGWGGFSLMRRLALLIMTTATGLKTPLRWVQRLKMIQRSRRRLPPRILKNRNLRAWKLRILLCHWQRLTFPKLRWMKMFQKPYLSVSMAAWKETWRKRFLSRP